LQILHTTKMTAHHLLLIAHHLVTCPSLLHIIFS